jgi:uncharacterized membrane protein (DUF106 family)
MEKDKNADDILSRMEKTIKEDDEQLKKLRQIEIDVAEAQINLIRNKSFKEIFIIFFLCSATIMMCCIIAEFIKYNL